MLTACSILNKIGYKKGMSIGLMIMAIGALVFISSAEARTYWVFLMGIFIQWVGKTILQTAANPYITILGPIESGTTLLEKNMLFATMANENRKKRQWL